MRTTPPTENFKCNNDYTEFKACDWSVNKKNRKV